MRCVYDIRVVSASVRQGTVEELDDGLHIIPKPLRGIRFETYHDHRMATAGAIVGLRVPGVVVTDVETTAKTLPGFTRLWEAMLAQAAHS